MLITTWGKGVWGRGQKREEKREKKRERNVCKERRESKSAIERERERTRKTGCIPSMYLLLLCLHGLRACRPPLRAQPPKWTCGQTLG